MAFKEMAVASSVALLLLFSLQAEAQFFTEPFAGAHYARPLFYPSLTTAKASPLNQHLLFPNSNQNRRLDQEEYPSQISPAFLQPQQTNLYPSHHTYGNFPFSFEPEAEFVPLEAQQHKTNQQQHQQAAATTLTKLRNPNIGVPEGRDGPLKPFEVDVITTDVNGNNDHSPGIFFQQAFPFIGNSFFNSFGGFGIGTQQEPWWKGPNVCIEKEEDEKMMDESSESEDMETTADGGSDSIKQHYFNQFHFSMNSCVEKPNKYVCKRIVNKNGKKRTLTMTRQCCYGYGRARGASYATLCEKIDIKDIAATAEDMGAKEFISRAKNTGLMDMFTTRRNFTVFLPTDEAFNSFSDLLQSENNLVERQSEGNEMMKELFLRHVVEGENLLDEIRNEQLLKTQVDGQNIRINVYQTPISLSSVPYRYTANCVPIVKHDKLSEQGLVHTLDGVLKPVDRTLMDVIRDRQDMSIMRTVLEKTELSKLLEGEKPITIFVPNDSAFEKLESHLRRALKEGKGCAANILKNHMLDLTFCSVAAVAGAKTTAYNLLGEPMRFNRSKETSEEETQSAPILINGVAKVLEQDIMGSNGVLHVIDTIMPTETALPLSSLMEEKNVTIFKRLLELSGLDNKFDDMDNVTVFAPTDKAMQNTKWAQMLEENPDNLQNDQELVEFLNYHLAQPMIKTCDLKEQLLNSSTNDKLRINLYSTHPLFSNVLNRATVNCARLVHFDDESCGSVLHQVDKPLQAPKLNLLQSLEANPNYSNFLELVKKANLSDLLTNTDQEYTLLVPKNDVFEELDEQQNPTKEGGEALEQLIKTHIVNDVVCCAGIMPTAWPFVRSMESLNGQALRLSRDRRPKVQNAGITKCDTVATNGIIHEINDIIVVSGAVGRRPEQRPTQTQTRPHYSGGQFPTQEDIFSEFFF